MKQDPTRDIKTEYLTIRLTPKLKQAIQNRAAKLGIPMASVVTMLIMGAARREKML